MIALDKTVPPARLREIAPPPAAGYGRPNVPRLYRNKREKERAKTRRRRARWRLMGLTANGTPWTRLVWKDRFRVDPYGGRHPGPSHPDGPCQCAWCLWGIP